jgi:hypothetical protein
MGFMIFMSFDEWLYLDVYTICRIIDFNFLFCSSVNFYSFDRWLDVNRIYKIAKFDHFARFPSFSLNSIDSVNFDDSDKLLIS